MDAKQKGILIDHRIPSTDTDQEYLEQYQGKIIDSQNRQLLPLKEDLADWINKSLGKSRFLMLGSEYSAVINIRTNFRS